MRGPGRNRLTPWLDVDRATMDRTYERAPLALTPRGPGRNMLAMIGRTARWAALRGLLVGLCLCVPLATDARSSAHRPPQNQMESREVEALRPAAERGDAEAQASLGVIYRFGLGVRMELAHALRWFRLAANQGHAKSQFNLGFMSEQGRGVPQDDTEAARWFRLAADQGLTSAQLRLSDMYWLGRGVPQDAEEAARWMRIAAEQGEPVAQVRLGDMCRRGRGVPRDIVEAARWYYLAADEGSSTAQFRLAVIEAELSAEQIAKAQRLAREWTPTGGQP